MKEKNQSGHCHLHYKTPRSDLHCIFLNLKDWTLFCFECQDTLYIDSFKRLREAVEVTKRMTEGKNLQNNQGVTAAGNKKQPAMMTNVKNVSNTTTFSNSDAVKVQKARGLNNLGNTCFFNAVMQCLNQSHYLSQVLDQHCQKGATFNTPMVSSTSGSSQYPDSGLGSETSSLLQREIYFWYTNFEKKGKYLFFDWNV